VKKAPVFLLTDSEYSWEVCRTVHAPNV